jgi:hypothetical protein
MGFLMIAKSTPAAAAATAGAHRLRGGVELVKKLVLIAVADKFWLTNAN